MTEVTTGNEMRKPRLALYWASSCGGCEVTVLDISERILDLAAAADLVFWPAVLDSKYSDVEAMPDQYIDVCLFNGAIRTDENAHLARLLRAKSKVMVAFGSCAATGGIPALANNFTRADVLSRSYLDSPTTVNPGGVLPQPHSTVTCDSGASVDLDLPAFHHSVRTLAQTVPVDYTVPGCPPVSDQVWSVLSTILAGQLPPRGAVLGASAKSVCEDCLRPRHEKRLQAFVRPHLTKPDPTQCLLDQGLACLGPATRGGCGAPCTKANMPCRGCYGAMPDVEDQGLKALSALASVLEAREPADVDRAIRTIPDPLGTFYRFGLAGSQLFRTRSQEDV
jgi:F420-non-reducing hydrogenase small subunit